MSLVAFGFIPWRLFLTGARVPEWLKPRRSTASNKAAPPQPGEQVKLLLRRSMTSINVFLQVSGRCLGGSTISHWLQGSFPRHGLLDARPWLAAASSIPSATKAGKVRLPKHSLQPRESLPGHALTIGREGGPLSPLPYMN